VTAVLTINPGSNSLQAVVVDASSEQVLDRASDESGLDDLLDHDLVAVGHRLVHGGSRVTRPTIVDDDVVSAIEAASSLAPLHVPVTLRLLAKLRRRLPTVPHVVCPDTGFHRDLPPVAHTYALPAQWREKFGLRRYGFHGLSYAWTASQVRVPNLLAAHLVVLR